MCWAGALALEPLFQLFFMIGFFKIGSFELFTQSGFEPKSSCSLPLK
jgi:hypothetical protein